MFKLSQWRKIIYLFHLERNKDHPRVIKRKNHSISRSSISPNALRILYRLSKSGYKAYLVGGSVRDMLLGYRPKDFDIVTDARPQEIRKLFKNSRLIGRRFRLVHIYFSNEIIEVSTFRANTQKLLKEEKSLNGVQKYEAGLLSEDNIYGTIEEDAWQRDFTVNALYYNIMDLSIIDFTGGLKDLHRQLIRIIGDPVQRYYEDPVRLLRAIRLSAKLNFKIHPDTEWSLRRLHNLLHRIPSTRLFTEVLKIFFEGHAACSYQLLNKTQYMQTLFLGTVFSLEKNKQSLYENLIKFALRATDERYNNKKRLSPAFLFAIFLWPVVQELMQQYFKKHKRLFPALYYGINTALQQQMKILSLPHRLTTMMRSVWLLQYHLERRRSDRIYRIIQQRFFQAALDFLELRERAGEPLSDIAFWWQIFRDGNDEQRTQLINELIRKGL